MSERLEVLESESRRGGCCDAIAETLDDAVAAFHGRLCCRTATVIAGHVGPFDRHTLLKLLDSKET